jgi:hypothetical protein
VLFLASNEPETPAWRPLIPHGRSRDRARGWLQTHSLAEDFSALRDRGKREQLDGHPSELPLILAHENVRPTGISAASRVGLSGGRDEAEFYAPVSLRTTLVQEHALRPAADGAVLARWVPDAFWPPLAKVEGTPSAAVLVDLLENDDPRARREAAASLS